MQFKESYSAPWEQIFIIHIKGNRKYTENVRLTLYIHWKPKPWEHIFIIRINGNRKYTENVRLTLYIHWKPMPWEHIFILHMNGYEKYTWEHIFIIRMNEKEKYTENVWLIRLYLTSTFSSIRLLKLLLSITIIQIRFWRTAWSTQYFCCYDPKIPKISKFSHHTLSENLSFYSTFLPVLELMYD